MDGTTYRLILKEGVDAGSVPFEKIGKNLSKLTHSDAEVRRNGSISIRFKYKTTLTPFDRHYLGQWGSVEEAGE